MPCAAAGWTSTEAPHSCAHNHRAIPLWPISYFHKVVKAPICSSSSTLPPVRNLTVAFIRSAAIQKLIRSSSCWTDWLGSTVGGQRYSNKKAKTNNWTWKGLVLPPDRRQKQKERVNPRFLIKEMAEAIFFFSGITEATNKKSPPPHLCDLQNPQGAFKGAECTVKLKSGLSSPPGTRPEIWLRWAVFSLFPALCSWKGINHEFQVTQPSSMDS